jgi:AcrR family transcriptional regulator
VTRDKEGGEQRLTRRAQARREGILEAALAVITHKGFHRTSIADIASRAQVSRATVYQHFADKRDIFGALADRIAGRIIATADAWPVLPREPAEEGGEEPPQVRGQALRSMIGARIAQILEAISQDADAARLIVRPPTGSDKLADEALRRIGDHIVEILTRDIEEASGNGLLRACDPSTVARFLLGGIEKLVIDALDREEPVRLNAEAVACEVGALVYHSLAHEELLTPIVGVQGPVPTIARSVVEKIGTD